ncbi:hypothetical protein EK21DRAFT_78483 [Setomelanomma holmii]|uniref:HRDC domain-containing protein n=1 Tax=Setomelanomma holmii TaxID=210430 RepID=A0A9P4GZP7_9PLEO|nr:hypothetical protein EK21DRAFT_78483 [Setomelanomma holmii]
MADTARNARPGDVDGEGLDSTKHEDEPTGRWPLAYKLQLPKQQQGQQSLQTFGFNSSLSARKCWWSHRLYKGPNDKPVQILYSKTRQDSETIARQFLDEPVVGFDMEWPWNDWKRSDLQNKIGLIQVASEEKIALFHIGLHPGKTTDDIIAPSLRKIIESPKIGKLGVGVLSADFARLRRYFRLNPRGAVELSHLYRLVKFGSYKPELVSTKLVSLARLVEDQLGHPLYKGDVRTSRWSKPLSRDQINYAAADAYAGYMLYYCMNYKRGRMKPRPPLPIHAEKYLELKLSGVIPLRLDAQAQDGTIMTSESFYGVKMSDAALSKSGKAKDKKASPVSKSIPPEPTLPKELIDETSQAIYQNLCLRRISLAQKAGVPVYRICANPVLLALALARPESKDQLLAIKGIGPKHQESYGAAWLEVINPSLSIDGKEAISGTDILATAAQSSEREHDATAEPPSTPSRASRSRLNQARSSPDSSPAFESPAKRTPQLHTGLSFTMAETKLDADESASNDDAVSCSSNDTLPSLDFGTPPVDSISLLKRKRTESASKERAHTASQRFQQLKQAQDTGSAPLDTVQEAAKTPTNAKALQVQHDPLTPQSRMARNKLSALSKLVTNKLPQRSQGKPPIVSERTLSLIIVRAPQTQDELDKIPGIDRFMLACQQTNTDLLKNIIKFTAARV